MKQIPGIKANKYLISGLLIIWVANAVVLAGVAYNRSEPPGAQLILTERELTTPYPGGYVRENSGIAMRINWRIPRQENQSVYARSFVLSEQQLVELGFAPDEVRQRGYNSRSRELFWVLELGGDSYVKGLQQAKAEWQQAEQKQQDAPSENHKNNALQRQKEFEQLQSQSSRLYVIEAGADYNKLINQYAAKRNIAIAKGLNRAEYDQNDRTYRLYFNRLLVDSIMLPVKYREIITRLPYQDPEMDIQAYAMTVNWGKRLEPWIADARATDKQVVKPAVE